MTRPAVAVDGWRRIVGTPAEVAAAVRQARASGRLEQMTYPQLMPGSRGQVYVHVRMREPARPPVRRWPLLAAAGAGLAALAGTVAAAAWVLAHWAQLAAAGIVALVILVGLGRRR